MTTRAAIPDCLQTPEERREAERTRLLRLGVKAATIHHVDRFDQWRSAVIDKGLEKEPIV